MAITVRPISQGSTLAGNRLSKRTPWITLAASFLASAGLFALLAVAG